MARRGASAGASNGKGEKSKSSAAGKRSASGRLIAPLRDESLPPSARPGGEEIGGGSHAVAPPAPEPALPPAPEPPPVEQARPESQIPKIEQWARPWADGAAGDESLLFEVAWEVCWQLGGIYTVLRSKAACEIERWGDRYFLIGPYNPQTAAVEFEETEAPGIIGVTLDRLRGQGIACHFGRWLIPGRPHVILLDYRARYWHLDSDKYLLWADHGIATSNNDGEVNEVTAFGFTVTEFFRNLCEVAPGQPVIAHFHEWMAGVPCPRIAHLKIPVATVFTTHATLLGRYMAGDSPEFYNHLPFINADEQAGKYNIYPRFAIERAAAHSATVFTTVSEVTAVEAEKLLGRKPDLILPNGLNIKRFAAIHEFQNLHREYKEVINQFVMGHFFPHYNFDLDRTLYVFTSGRYEYRNKGLDLFIEAMHRLNERLKHVPDPPTVVAFIVTKAPVKSINVGVLQSQSIFEDLKDTTERIKDDMGERLFELAARGKLPTRLDELMDQDAVVRLKQSIHAWRNTSRPQPPVVTHDLADDAKDAVLQQIRYRGLFNAAHDPVKMVFHPQFVTATSPLISLDYEQFVRGCHLGIFPSYYEPWGYTPMESIALGVPAVTTDLSGFGAYVERQVTDSENQGVLVINRRHQSFDRATEQLVDYLLRFTALNRRQRVELRNRTERLSELFDWSVLISHYNDAHDLALARALPGRQGKLEVKMV